MTSRITRYTLLSLFLLINQIHAERKIISIKTPGDLIKFSNKVNNGERIFKGTVVLENDLDMSKVSSSFNPIGLNKEKTFSGEFDGKGYTLSNLNITTDKSRYVGLFGYSFGMTLKNLIFDYSSITSAKKSNKHSYLGGFVSYCLSKESGCVFKNLINMAALYGHGYEFIGGHYWCNHIRFFINLRFIYRELFELWKH